MLLHRFYDHGLAQTSYLLGCERTGEALVVDPNRDVSEYIETAADYRLRITRVTETHIHADFVSGSRELAERTGSKLYLSGEGGRDWSYGFAAETGAILLRDGDTFDAGSVQIRVLHTPGHTPEHLTFLVTDGETATEPIAALTGDFVFVGDVGRPDLLERAAQVAGTMEDSARMLFRSLQRFKTQPDYLQLWPGHGAGSACGKSLSAIPQSTLGYERRFNWAFASTDEDEFVRLVLMGQPEPPRYFGTMKRMNRDGPRLLGGPPAAPLLRPEELRSLLDAGAFVIDARPAADFAARHVPGTISIPLNRSFTTWAGWLAPYDQDLYLIVRDAAGREVAQAELDLSMIGLDRVAGVFGADAVAAWGAGGHPTAGVHRIGSAEATERVKAGAVLLDVRGQAEWEAGHIPGAVHIPLGYLQERIAELPADAPVVVHCQGGSRSAIAAGVLQRAGVGEVYDLTDGFKGWRAAGLPVTNGKVS
ncbi:MAG TPA: MBL fold metallo-hydrolase [Gemmatimonadales bacterium]|nr:MBL fold metallo-hydrolase [Gemmatimonadales bacterium]